MVWTRLAATTIAAVALGVSGTATAQSRTIATNTTGSNGVTGYAVGQSFTTPTTSPLYNNVAVSFQDASGTNLGTAGSKVYLFSAAYTGTPSGLANSTTSLGSATFANGIYTFSPALTLNGSTQYFAYDDTASGFTYSGTDTYTGGNLYAASSQTSNFSSYAGLDARFVVTAAAAPEPAAWSLIILGFGIVGGTLRRQKRRVTISTSGTVSA